MDGLLQPALSLVVSLRGGYGMFCDPPLTREPYDPDFDRLLCHDCSHELCDFLGVDTSGFHAEPGTAGLAFAPALPTDALAEVSALLDTPADEPTRCSRCSQLDAAVRDALASAPSAMDALSAAASVLSDPHVGSESFHEGVVAEQSWCDYDLLMIRDLAVLARAGIPAALAWGPGHAAGRVHPQDWQECASCVTWVASRQQARAMAAAAGVDVSAVLSGPDVPPPLPSRT